MKYSLYYADRSKSLQDSAKARKRIGSFCNSLCQQIKHLTIDIDRDLRQKQGVVMASYGEHPFDVERFFDEGELGDVLSAITTIYEATRSHDKATPRYGTSQSNALLLHVRKVFAEECMAYTADDNCYVRNKVDDEFNRNVFSSVAALEDPRYAHVRDALERSLNATFNPAVNDTSPINLMFEACETLFKLLTGAASLDSKLVGNELIPKVQKAYSSKDAHAQAAAASICNGLGKWVDACHKFRHGPNSEEISRPPVEISVALVSQGATFIRWLADVDQQLLPAV
jgi:hypothetical protein